MKINELKRRIEQVQRLARDIQSIRETADMIETMSTGVGVVVCSITCIIPTHSAVIMLRVEEKRVKEARDAVMVEFNLEDEDEPT